MVTLDASKADSFIGEVLRKQNEDTSYLPSTEELDQLFQIIEDYGDKPPAQNHPPLRAIMSLMKVHSGLITVVAQRAEEVLSNNTDFSLQVRSALQRLIARMSGM